MEQLIEFEKSLQAESDIEKVDRFIGENPVSQAFLKREKGRLPYSVFKPTAEVVKFLKSQYAGRPPTILFSYPAYVNSKHPIETTADDETLKVYDRRAQIEVLFFSFLNSDRTHVYNAVVNTMKNGGFEMLERGDDFNLIWTGYTTVLDILPLNKYQRINHFPNSIALGRKDLFWNQLLNFKKKYPTAFNVTPHSWRSTLGTICLALPARSQFGRG